MIELEGKIMKLEKPWLIAQAIGASQLLSNIFHINLEKHIRREEDLAVLIHQANTIYEKDMRDIINQKIKESPLGFERTIYNIREQMLKGTFKF